MLEMMLGDPVAEVAVSGRKLFTEGRCSSRLSMYLTTNAPHVVSTSRVDRGVAEEPRYVIRITFDQNLTLPTFTGTGSKTSTDTLVKPYYVGGGSNYVDIGVTDAAGAWLNPLTPEFVFHFTIATGW